MTDTTTPWVQRQLTQLLAQRGHAWLLQGPSGLGQFDLGLGLAQAWLCEQATPAGACGQCDSCHLVRTHAHPDLVVLLPETEALHRGWPLSEQAQKELDDKKRKPSKEIRVDAMRDMVAFAQRTAARGRGTAVLVYPAERMNHVTANGLLKTLEEPPGDTRFVLASEAAHQLLPTIRSRCQTHAMAWPAAPEAVAWMLAQWSARSKTPGTPEQAQAWLQAAGGRPEDALLLALAGMSEQTWSGLPSALARGDWSALEAFPAAEQLSVLQKLCHDLMAVSAGAQPRYFSADQLPVGVRMAALGAWSRELMEAARSVEHPYNAGLMQEAWASRARQVLRTRPG